MIKQLSSIIITMLLFLNSTILLIQTSSSSSLSDDEMQRDIEETQKETELLKKCMENDYKFDYCDKSALIK